MDQRLNHDCPKSSQELKATVEAPYHFVDSGLPNVYLVGMKYFVCSVCDRVRAEIPAVGELMNALARAVVQKTSPLSGVEVKFLRKRLGLKATDFGQIMSVTPEQVSRWENDHNPPAGATDRLIRLGYSFMSRDIKLKGLVDKVKSEFQKWSTSIHATGASERILAEHTGKSQWRAATESIAA